MTTEAENKCEIFVGFCVPIMTFWKSHNALCALAVGTMAVIALDRAFTAFPIARLCDALSSARNEITETRKLKPNRPDPSAPDPLQDFPKA